MLKILFVCIHNSARSQMAEELLRQKLGDKVHIESAGLEPGNINPIVVDVLKTRQIDISNKGTQVVFDLIRKSARFHYVITVCDETSGERCPIFPGVVKRLHWSFPDPSSFDGSYDEKVAMTKDVMALIDAKLDEFTKEIVELQILTQPDV